MIRDSGDENDPGPYFERRRRAPLVILAAVLVIGAGAVGFLLMRRTQPPAPVAAVPQPPARLATPEEADQAEQHAAQVLSKAGVGTDGWLRAQLGGLSTSPDWQNWIAATRDLTDSAAVIVANVADDDDPHKRLVPLRLLQDFATVSDGKGGPATEAPESAARFDRPVSVIESLDSKALGLIYRGIHPLISVAYHGVARPGVSLDRAAGAALRRIEEAPVPSTAPAVQRVGKLWLYADPEIEKLGPIEKLLIRMGPVNERKLQAKAAELHKALGVP